MKTLKEKGIANWNEEEHVSITYVSNNLDQSLKIILYKKRFLTQKFKLTKPQ
jgi:hypothetical protein